MDQNKFDYNSINPGYYDRIFHQRKGIQSKWHHLKFSHVQSLLGDYGDHLDIGCGPGTFIGLLDENKRSIGVDVSALQIAYANQHYGTPVHKFVPVTDNEPLPFSEESFDVITIIEVIEHLSWPVIITMLKKAYQLLKKEGRLIITTPNYRSLWPVIEFVINKTKPVTYEDQHISKFNKKKLKEIFKECCFSDYQIANFY